MQHLMDRGGRYTLVAAACFGDIEQIQVLKRSASRPDIITALTAAAFYGNLEILSALLEGGGAKRISRIWLQQPCQPIAPGRKFGFS